MKNSSILLATIVLLACNQTSENRHYTVLAYQDFGPPSLAHPLIGLDYWQWENHGASRPKTYPIDVVVYRDIDLEEVKKLFPVNKVKKQDFRYVAFTEAIAYLDDAIAMVQSYEEEVFTGLLKTLIQTRRTLKTKLET